MSFELPLQIIILRIIALLLVGMVHGVALVGMVTALGDRGARFEGRLSLNPLVHAAPLGIVAAVMSMAGWIRPLDIDPAHLRHGRAGLAGAVLVSLIVPMALFMALLQLRGLTIAYLPASYSNMINLALRICAQMSITFAIINLIPLPPFAGGYLLQALSQKLYAMVQPRTIIIALVLVGLAVLDRGAIFRAIEPYLRTFTGA
ncbi:zinc metalloprotease [Devosia faecipullorum]|uniref:hypothetical protein n=1 Tax=Devosia faecipullorum TaxID=2755039 RepID=UPI00187B50EB|nr:hypothetical protein [Devosia faecipullorum]MBE7733186.1 hypothetical protein [Devosia faecipullorum]